MTQEQCDKRMARLKETNPELYQEFLKRGLDKVENWIEIKTETEAASDD